MKYRNTIIALVILIFLGSYIYFFERKPIKELEPGKPTAPFIHKFDAEKVAKLKIIHQDTTKPIAIERTKDNSWELKLPVVAKVDKFEVDNLVNEFKDLVPSRILEEKDLNLANYGLNTPALTLILSFSDTKLVSEKVQVGNKTPNAEDYYVKKENENKVYLIPVKTVAMWDKEVTAFRDKTVLDFDSDRINWIELIYPNIKFVCLKEKNQWWVTEPEKVEADWNKLDDLLWKLHRLEVKQFVDEQPKDLKQYGLTQPQVEFIMKSQNGKLYTLAIGKIKSDSSTVYAKTADKSYIFSLETTAVKELAIASINDLRDRSVLTFDIDSITGIELKYPEKTLTCSKEKEQWWLTQPDSVRASSDKPKRFTVDETKINDILWRINGLSIRVLGEVKPKNLNKYGLDKPVLSVTLQSNTTKFPMLVLGKIDDKNHLIYALVSDKNYVFQLDDSLIQDLKVSETELQDKKADTKSK